MTDLPAASPEAAAAPDDAASLPPSAAAAPNSAAPAPTASAPDPTRHEARHEMPDALRADVRLLGELLGQVLTEAGGPDLLQDVERLRALTIDAASSDTPTAFAEAEALVETLSHQRAEEVARAFTCYFHLVNLAEEYHRVRALRRRDQALQSRPESSFPAAFAQLSTELGPQEAERRLHALEFHPVLTAHPTEARRRSISAAIRRISVLVAERDDPRLGDAALADNRRLLLAEVDSLWRTAQLRSHKPSPLDEVRTAMGVFDETLFQAVPTVYRYLDDWLLGDDAGRAAPAVPPFVRLGSWIGGDRDGNPFVTASVTRAAAEIAHQHVLLGYEQVAAALARTLTMDDAGTPASADLRDLAARHTELLGADRAQQIDARSQDSPYRRAMLAIRERVIETRLGCGRGRDGAAPQDVPGCEDLGESPAAYGSARELEHELTVVQRSLLAAGDTRAAYGKLQEFLWQVQTFGFHLAELEVRQHSTVHARALEAIATAGGPTEDLDEQTTEVLAVFRVIKELQDRFGVEACRRYIVSFTHSASDLEAVHTLARYAMPQGTEPPVLDVIPLFETFADLQGSVDVLEEAAALPEVQARLEQTGGRLEVMLGYSDSSKDVGPVSANLGLYDAQARITEWGQRRGLTLTLFHGRGGALGRGGGPANRAVLAQPPGSVDGRFKLTEQGEVIFARYGDPDIAIRHIEQVAAATLLAGAPSVEERNARAAATYAGLADALDDAARTHYHRLVRCEGFAQWFAQVTPQEEIGLLAIGSRPAKRGLSVSSLEDLRAIPWVFAWSQARINLAGWFGIGTALAEVGDLELLRSAYEDWPLFTALIDNMEMSLAKTDERIARRYLELGERSDLAELVLDELALARRWVLAVTGQERLLERRRVLGRAVQLRNPYVDALSLIQLCALRGLRIDDGARAAGDGDGGAGGGVVGGGGGLGSGGERDVDGLRRLLLLSVNGIAAGLQNTG